MFRGSALRRSRCGSRVWKTRAGGVKRERCDIVVQRHLNGVGFFLLGQRLCTVLLLQTLHNGFFRDRLAIAYAHQLRTRAVAADGKFRVLRNKLLPWQALYALKQRVERFRFQPADDEQHPVGAAEP